MEGLLEIFLSEPLLAVILGLVCLLVYNYASRRRLSRKLKRKNRKLHKAKVKFVRKAGSLRNQLENAKRYQDLATRRHHASVTNLSIRSQFQKQRVDDLIDVLKDRSREISNLKRGN